MKAIKRISLSLIVALMLTLCLVLTACGGDCEEHTFGEWTVVTDSTCTAEGQKTRQCTECDFVETDVIAKKEHTGEWVKNGTTETITCTVCGQTETRDIVCTEHTGGIVCDNCGKRTVDLEAILPELAELSNVGIVVKDVCIDTTVDDPEFGEITEIELFEFVFYADENGALKGYGEGAVSVKDGADAPAQNMAFVGTLEGGKLYMAIDGTMNGIPASINVAVALENLTALSEQAYMATEMIEQYLPAIEEWINKSFLPVFGTPSLEGEFDEEQITAAAEDAIYAIADTLFTVTETESGKTLTLSLDFIKNINNELNTLKVSELVDKYVGEGAFVQLKASFIELLPFSVGTVVEFVTTTLDVDLDALFTSLDELAVIITGADTATFEMLIGMEGDVSAMLKDPELLAYSLKDFLMMQGEYENEIALVAGINEAFAELEKNTVYTLAGITAENVEAINKAVDEAGKMLSLTVSLDKDGKLVSVNATATLPAEDEAAEATEITLTVVADKMTVSIESAATTLNAELILNSELKADAEKAAALVAAADSVPEFTAELIEKLGALPIYEGEQIIGLVLDYDLIDANTVGDVSYLTVQQEVMYLSDIVIYGTADGCGDSIMVIYMVRSLLESVEYTITKETLEGKVDADAGLEQSLICAIVYGDREVLESQPWDTADIDFVYDPETGDVSTEMNGPYGHDVTLDAEKSDDMSTLTCGDAYTLSFYCTKCDFTFEQSGKVPHDYEYDSENSVSGETCLDPSFDVYVCINCGDSYQQDYDTPCSYEYDEEKSQTEDDVLCGEEYVVVYVCRTCGDSYEYTYTKDHDYEYSDELSDDPTGLPCGAEYNEALVCIYCGDTVYDVATKEHDYTYTYEQTEPGLYQASRRCTNCDMPNEPSHEYNVVLLTDKATLELRTSEDGDGYEDTDYAIDFNLTVTETGTYRIYATGADGGMYLHFYRDNPFEYICTDYGTEDGLDMTYELSSEEEYYFSAFFYLVENEEGYYSCTLYIEFIPAE